jgi:hypothetical protein
LIDHQAGHDRAQSDKEALLLESIGKRRKQIVRSPFVDVLHQHIGLDME